MALQCILENYIRVVNDSCLASNIGCSTAPKKHRQKLQKSKKRRHCMAWHELVLHPIFCPWTKGLNDCDEYTLHCSVWKFLPARLTPLISLCPLVPMGHSKNNKIHKTKDTNSKSLIWVKKTVTVNTLIFCYCPPTWTKRTNTDGIFLWGQLGKYTRGTPTFKVPGPSKKSITVATTQNTSRHLILVYSLAQDLWYPLDFWHVF